MRGLSLSVPLLLNRSSSLLAPLSSLDRGQILMGVVVDVKVCYLQEDYSPFEECNHSGAVVQYRHNASETTLSQRHFQRPRRRNIFIH